MSETRPDIVVLVPVPVVITSPGLRINVQVPVEGNPFNTTLPVATEHVGWVITPTTGAEGVSGCVLIVAFVPGEIQPAALLAVTLYEPGSTSVKTPVLFVYVVPSML